MEQQAQQQIEGGISINGELQEKLDKANKRIKELRGYLARSVAKECKCEANTEVNHLVINRNLSFRDRIKELENLLEQK